jgi:CCR4-NOT transcriptional complex subunit CAF120
MDRTKLKNEDWVRVRFGAGTPWRRCWCVITPPDEKEYQKVQKEFNKKKSAYDRSKPPVLKGDVKFYETRKTKKAQPIAQITNAYSAFAIYPQSKPLIDASTLIKLEGTITIFSNPPSSIEGFVFVMPEVHPAVSGFEMLLRWLFPVWDTFALYGRPTRLLADTVNPNSLMFAMPKDRRYGYLEILDVSGLILTDESHNWSEMEWRRNMKDLSARRMNTIGTGSRSASRMGSRAGHRNSIGGTSQSRTEFNDSSPVKSTKRLSWGQAAPAEVALSDRTRTDSAPPKIHSHLLPSQPGSAHHGRSVSDTQGIERFRNQSPVPYDGGYESAPPPPPHRSNLASGSSLRYESDRLESPERASVDERNTPARSTPVRELQELQDERTPEPVAKPPAFAHAPGSLPAAKPFQSPELRRANSRMSTTTLAQLAGASGIAPGTTLPMDYGSTVAQDAQAQAYGRYEEDRDQRGVLSFANNPSEMNANSNGLTEGLVAGRNDRTSLESPAHPQGPMHPGTLRQNSQPSNIPYPSPKPNNSHDQLYFDMTRPLPPSPAAHDSYQNTPADYQSSTQTQNPLFRHSIQPPPSTRPAPSHSHSHSSDFGRSQFPENEASRSIHRKPLPSPSIVPPPERHSLQSASSEDSMERVIDQAGFDQIVPLSHPDSNMLAPQPLPHRQGSATSLYEENASLQQAVYTSRPANDRASFERPRAGVMRTVGGTEQGSYTQAAHADAIQADIPTFDFGRTPNLAPNLMKPLSDPRKFSPVRGNSPVQKDSPVRQGSPSRPQAGRNTSSVDPSHRRTDSAPGIPIKSVPWKPGMAAGTSNDSNARPLTPEQFVQQRAALAAGPLYAHHRQHSSNSSRSATPPRGHSREPSSLSRNNSSELLARPSSRSSSHLLNASRPADQAPRPTNGEQERVTRNFSSAYPKVPAPDNRADNRGPTTPGLIYAIDAREREKNEIRQGLNSLAAQNNMARYQQQSQMAPHVQPGGYGPVQPTMQSYGQPQMGYGGAMQANPQSDPFMEPPQAPYHEYYAPQGGAPSPGAVWGRPQDQQYYYEQQYQQYPQGGRGRGSGPRY